MKPDFKEESDSIHEMPTRTHLDVYKKIQSRVGLKEDTEYQRLYDPDNVWGEALRPLALRNFKRFVATVYHLATIENKQFDLMIGGGDSGIALAKLTEMIYQRLDIPSPKRVNMPIVRFDYTEPDGRPLNLFDNSVLIPEMADELGHLKKLEHILLVDDEIRNGITAGEAIKVALEAVNPAAKVDHPEVVIVAEEQGFEPDKFLDGTVKTEFYPFAEDVDDMKGVVNYFVPWEIEKQILEHFDDKQMSAKYRLNALLNLPDKESYVQNGIPIFRPKFTYEHTEKIKRTVPRFAELQHQFRKLVTGWIDEAVEEYKQDDM